jgi:hypothetical protein
MTRTNLFMANIPVSVLGLTGGTVWPCRPTNYFPIRVARRKVGRQGSRPSPEMNNRAAGSALEKAFLNRRAH